ncbi:Condensin complex component SMC4 [Pseudozyma hubeiensis]|nr:Condensin complex component SMC4 [Pseudozyma hubeiensis]
MGPLVVRQADEIANAGGHYKAIGTLEDKVNIALGVAAGLVTVVASGLAGMRVIEHLACENVAKQERTMQKSWDEMHPDGFTPAGDQMRPASFDCNAQERKFKPLKSYLGAPSWY